MLEKLRKTIYYNAIRTVQETLVLQRQTQIHRHKAAVYNLTETNHSHQIFNQSV